MSARRTGRGIHHSQEHELNRITKYVENLEQAKGAPYGEWKDFQSSLAKASASFEWMDLVEAWIEVNFARVCA